MKVLRSYFKIKQLIDSITSFNLHSEALATRMNIERIRFLSANLSSRFDWTQIGNEQATNLGKFVKSFIDKNDRDEDREDFLGESGDVSDQERTLQCDHNNADDANP